MKLTLWRVVVVLNTHTKFRKNRPFHHPSLFWVLLTRTITLHDGLSLPGSNPLLYYNRTCCVNTRSSKCADKVDLSGRFQTHSTSIQHVSTRLKGGSKRFQPDCCSTKSNPDVEANVEAVCPGLYSIFLNLNLKYFLLRSISRIQT